MDIKLIPIGSGSTFTFPALPEKIQGKYSSKYQSFDIISQGTIKIPRGMDGTEFTWDGVFFGESKKKEPIVRKNNWKAPEECIKILTQWMEKEAVLNLIVTETWINVDVTIASFQPKAIGAYGNVEYSITLIQKRPLQIYTTKELQVGQPVKKIRTRNEGTKSGGGGTYTVVSGDTLWAIAAKKLGSSSKWTQIYQANVDTIEAWAKKHGKANSDHGHWIWAGEVLTLPE